MSEITPTVSRKVWFFENGQQLEPHDATIIKVHGTTPQAAVNLDVVHPDTGQHMLRTSVVVGDETTAGTHYRWMPYQKGQAAKDANASLSAEDQKTMAQTELVRAEVELVRAQTETERERAAVMRSHRLSQGRIAVEDQGGQCAETGTAAAKAVTAA